jgi:hypothetical protein
MKMGIWFIGLLVAAKIVGLVVVHFVSQIRM